MPLAQLLPSIPGLVLGEVKITQALVELNLVSTCQISLCPLCKTSSSHKQSHYFRILMDVPWALKTVHFRLRARRFYCRNEGCERKIFTERFEYEIYSYARRTQRVNKGLESIGFSTGGVVGASISKLLAMAISPSTMLRVLRRSPELSFETPRVLGVDDWAFRKGSTYGTILVDLEKRRPIDLLPDREAETLANWLKEHPGVEIITRDRAGSYSEGAREGAPGAIQIADRWHLLKNMGDAIQRMLRGKGSIIKEATYAFYGIDDQEPEEIDNSEKMEKEIPLPLGESIRLSNFQQVKQMQKEGKSIGFMSRELGIHRQTVRNFIACEEFPRKTLARTAYRNLKPYIGFIKKRWEEGVNSPKQLWREVLEKNASIDYKSVYRLCRRLFGLIRNHPDLQVAQKVKPPAFSARKASMLLSKQTEELSDQENLFCMSLCQKSPEINNCYPRIQEFCQMIKERKVQCLDSWLEMTLESESKSLVNFAEGLMQDYHAVRAALNYYWSNGQVEGQVNRLKNIKRQMYGRASFELLRRRVLHRARDG